MARYCSWRSLEPHRSVAQMLLTVVLAVLALPAAAACAYLALLTALSWPSAPAPAAARRRTFAVVIPAHDEEAGIARTVASVLAVRWPRERLRVVVVADNCHDGTADRAAEAGAQVLVRTDPVHRGKGFALEHAFRLVLGDGVTDAVVIVDADTVVSPNLLEAFASRLDGGALAIQARYGVLNTTASWRTRLMAVAFALFHDLRSTARERLRVSCGLRGNGMCFAREALLRAPHQAYSIVEDLEYGIRLGEAGIRVHYAGEAEVLGDMAAGGHAARTQRRRWERGRLAMVRSHGLRLLGAGLRRRDPVLLDLAADVLVPPLGWIAGYALAGSTAATFSWLRLGGSPAVLAGWLVPCALLGAYVLRGVQLSGTGVRGLLALAWAPVYVLWKLPVVVSSAREGRGTWIRTARGE